MFAWPRPTVARYAVAFAVSWASMLAHNVFELPLSPVALENSGPLMVDVALLAAVWLRPRSQLVQVFVLSCYGMDRQ